jgi:hypothetical protein
MVCGFARWTGTPSHTFGTLILPLSIARQGVKHKDYWHQKANFREFPKKRTSYKMTTNHTKILNAYLSRFTLRDMKELLEAKNNCMHKALNEGMTSQIIAAERFEETVTRAINNLIQHDINLIEQIITKETAE